MMRRQVVLASFLMITVTLSLVAFAQQQEIQQQPVAPSPRAAWMGEARWGVMTHYLADWRAQVDKDTPDGKPNPEHWNELVDHFDAEGLAEQLKSVGAGYYLITIGQNSGFYAAPNATYDKITGFSPSHCSRRDLISDLYPALHKRGIHLVVYLGSGGGQMMPGDRNDPRRKEAQLAWYSCIRDWSLRFGPKVEGWWFDGCYTANAMYRHEDEPNFKTFAEAARAGNPNAAVAFNPGVCDRAFSITPYEDWIAGEINFLDRARISRPSPPGYVDGAKIQYLSFLGQTWGKGAPRYTAEQVASMTAKAVGQGATVTWDTPIQKNGLIAKEFIDQLSAVGKAVKAAPAPGNTKTGAKKGTGKKGAGKKKTA